MNTNNHSWRDTSSWARDEIRPAPKEWTLDTGELRIVVHRLFALGDEWFMTCRGVGIERKPLETADADVAKRAARNEVEIRLRSMLMSLEGK